MIDKPDTGKADSDSDVSQAVADSKTNSKPGSPQLGVTKRISKDITAAESKFELFLDAGVLRYKKWRLNRAAKSKAYLSYNGKTQTWAETFFKTGFGLVFELLTIAIGIVFLWFNALFFFLKAETVDLRVLKPHAAQWFSETFAGRSASLDTLHVDWVKERQSLSVTARGVRVNETGGIDLLEIPNITTEFDLASLVFGRLLMTRSEIDGGSVTAFRNSDGEMSFGLGRPETLGRFGPVLQPGQSAFTGRDSELDINSQNTLPKSAQKWRAIESIKITNGEAYVIDQVSGLDWKLEALNLDYSANEDGLQINTDSNIISKDEVTPFTVNFLSNPDLTDFEIDLDLAGFKPANLAPARGQFALARALDAPVSLKTSISASAQSGLTQLSVDFKAGEGVLNLPSGATPFSSAALIGQYNVTTQSLDVSKIDIKSERLNVDGKAVISDIGSPDTGFGKKPVMVDLDLKPAYLDLGPKFRQPYNIEFLTGILEYNIQEKVLNFNDIDLNLNDNVAAFSGQLVLREKDEFSNIPIQNLILSGRINGPIKPKAVLDHWPLGLAPYTHRWIETRIIDADISNLELQANIPFSSLLQGALEDEDLNLTFDLAQSSARYISTMTPFHDAYGRATLRGNSFGVTIDSARVGESIVINSGQVDILKFRPRGSNLVLTLNTSGDASDILSLIDEPPLHLASKAKLIPQQFSGYGTADLLLTRPMLGVVPASEIKYAVKGKFETLGAPTLFDDVRVTDGEIDLYVDNNGIEISGPITLGQWRAHFDMNNSFGVDSAAPRYAVTGRVTRDDLDRFGIGLREYFGGDVDLTLKGVSEAGVFIGADMSADLTNASLSLGDVWTKTKGVDGRLETRILFQDNGGSRAQNIKIATQGLAVTGSLDLAKDLRLLGFDLPQVKIDNFIEATVSARSERVGDMLVQMQAKYLDVSRWANAIVTPKSQGAASVPLQLEASVDSLVLNDSFTLDNANINYQADVRGVIDARIVGKYEREDFITDITALPDGAGRSLNVQIPDAGLALKELYDFRNIEGGQFKLLGTLPERGVPGALSATATIRDFKLVDAPVFARILSLASLQGLGEILSGDGMNFNTLELPFDYENGVIVVNEATASSSAIGLTGTGRVSFRDDTLDLNGVIVPSYTFNSLLGGIPIIGDIVVGKKGEGIFALNYSIGGTFAKTQVSVNPLSALTPGFLRQIFQPTVQKPLETSPEADANTQSQ